jgi:hypothetical protein
VQPASIRLAQVVSVNWIRDSLKESRKVSVVYVKDTSHFSVQLLFSSTTIAGTWTKFLIRNLLRHQKSKYGPQVKRKSADLADPTFALSRSGSTSAKEL